MRVVLLVLTGCGRLAFDLDSRSDGGGVDDTMVDAAIDAAVDAPAGALVASFGETDLETFNGVTTDTVLDSVNIGANYGGRATLDLDNQWTPLVRFDVSTIPSAATVFEAALTLWTTNDATTGTVSVHRLLEVWTEGSSNGQLGAANYFERQTAVGWFNPGASGLSRASAASASFTPSTPDTAYTVLLAPALVQTWVADAGENKGIVLDMSGSDSVRFVSSEGGVIARRPVLRVTYLP